MAFIDWNSNLSVGVEMFDEQHKKLISIINKLYDAMKEKKGKEVLEEVFNELVEYTKTHFKSEEDMMMKFNYPYYAEHLKEHNDLTKTAMDLIEKYKKGDLFVTIETLNFLKEWLSHHILETDKKYGPFFKGKI